jgi:hypothetical protein
MKMLQLLVLLCWASGCATVSNVVDVQPTLYRVVYLTTSSSSQLQASLRRECILSFNTFMQYKRAAAQSPNTEEFLRLEQENRDTCALYNDYKTYQEQDVMGTRE